MDVLRRTRQSAAAFAAFLLLAASDPLAATTVTVEDVPAANGTQRFLYVRPDNPVATLVHVPGGGGILGIQADGRMTTQVATCSPVDRTRDTLLAQGFAIAFVDQTSNGSTYDYNDIKEVVRFVRNRDNVPVWVLGGSAATGAIATLARNLPTTDPVGAIFYSPGALPVNIASAVTRTAFVLAHALDPDTSPAQVFNALGSTVKERASITGGNNGGCGYHLFNGTEAQFSAAIIDFIGRHNAALMTGTAVNYQGLWWRSPGGSENGWGLNLAHQGDTLFMTWFTYDENGRPTWYVMSDGRKTGQGTYTGALYRPTGAPFTNYSAAQFMPNPAVGSVTFTFTDVDNGTFAYTVGAVTQTKPITRNKYSSPVPTCAPGAVGATNFQDLWWASPAGSEDGWGVNLTHQGNILFATWFTYGADGQPTWFVMSGLERVGGTQRYTGAIYRTVGSPFANYDVSRFNFTPAGSATFEFTGASAGTFTYTVDGLTQVKPITRTEFSSPTNCQ